MTVSSIKVKVVRRPTLKLKVLPRFPANIVAANFITLLRNGGTYTLGADFTVLTPGPIVDPTTAYIAILDQTSGIYRTVTLASLLTSGLDADIQAIAALSSTGILVRTASNTWALRALTAPAAGITITNPDGVAGNPTLALANDLAAVEGLASTGIAARTATDTWAVRTITAGASMGVTNGDGVAGNPTIALTDAELVALAGLTSAADQVPYFTGSGTAALASFPSYGRSLAASASQAAARTTLALTPGTDVQAFDADLAALAANAGTGLWSITGSGTGSVRTLTGPAAGITVTNGGGVAGNPTLALANDLAALEGLASTGIARRTATDTWSVGTAVALTEMATQAAFTLVGNNTSGSAAPTAVDISLLTAKASPVATDLVMISDQAASGAWKKVTISSLASAGSVSSIAGNTGAFTLSNGIKNVTNDIQADPVFHRSYLAGLTLSTAGASTSFGIAVGIAVDGTNTAFMSLTSSYTKTTGTWAVLSFGGALDTGTIANSTWYHVYVIKRPDTGVVDIAISLSASAPTTGGAIPAAYTLFRRIGSMKTDGSGNWTKFSQLGDEFLWDTQVQDGNSAALNTTATLATLSVPMGVQTWARISFASNPGGTVYYYISSPDSADVLPSISNFTGFAIAAAPIQWSGDVRTDTSSRIRFRASASAAGAYWHTRGWIDARGRNN